MAANSLQIRVLLSALDKVTAPLKRIMAGSNSTAKALKAARDQVKALNAQQSDISSYNRQHDAVRQTGEELARAQQRLRQYQEQLKAMDAPSAAFQKTFINASAAVDRLKTKHGEQRAELQRLIPKLREAGIDTRNLAESEKQLKTRIDAANEAYKTQKERLASVAAKQEKLARVKASYSKGQELAGSAAMLGASSAATGAALGGPIVGIVKNYSSFEDAMLGVAKQVEGARDDNGKLTSTYYEMGEAIKKMSETIPMASTEIAALVEGGARMGIQGKDNLLEFARVAANASTAFEIPADQIGENLARIADLFKVPIKNVSQLGDVINYLDDNAKSKGADIIDVMQRVAGVTASVGMSYKDAAALGSTFLTLGSSAEVAGTATNAMIRELAIANEQPKRFQAGLKALGMESKKIQTSMTKDATGTILKVLDALKKLPQEQQLTVATQLFGKEYGDDASKLANNLEEYRRQLELTKSAKGNGSMQRESDIRGDALSARATMSQNRLFNLSADLGKTLRPALIEIMDKLNGVLEKVTAWAAANPALVTTLLKVTAGVAAASMAFGTLALGLAGILGPGLAIRFMFAQLGVRIPSLIGGLFSLAKNALPMVATGIRLVTAAAMANPILALITGIALAATLIYQNWETVGPWFASLWQEIKSGFSNGIAGVVGLLANFSPLGLMYSAWSGVLNYLGIELPAKFTGFGGMIIDGLINGMTGQLGALRDSVVNVAGAMWTSFKEKMGIHSPSRVFAQLGDFTMQGLAVGLAKGEDGPLSQMANTAKRLTAAGAVAVGVGTAATPAMAGITFDDRPPVSQRAAPAPVAGDTYHFTINAAPGMDAQAIAKAVRAELARAKSEQSARGRSSLRDQE
ncbi:phage tail tape measure protein, TP901 family, core region [Pseudomonas sp. HPB0071]|uniref:phage tail tape measure protein n=1 Tax=Pseudomonas sp. HPB0071 TaxID=1203578 RepID=UPI0002C9D7BE|nr:phage tail tape measure protein [Pseudomonas sp. HPB0071]ENA26419.1 phage tail tape measure protein, TP901 family, core region [Pseudomonas sp. HPB0071]